MYSFKDAKRLKQQIENGCAVKLSPLPHSAIVSQRVEKVKGENIQHNLVGPVIHFNELDTSSPKNSDASTYKNDVDALKMNSKKNMLVKNSVGIEECVNKLNDESAGLVEKHVLELNDNIRPHSIEPVIQVIELERNTQHNLDAYTSRTNEHTTEIYESTSIEVEPITKIKEHGELKEKLQQDYVEAIIPVEESNVELDENLQRVSIEAIIPVEESNVELDKNVQQDFTRTSIRIEEPNVQLNENIQQDYTVTAISVEKRTDGLPIINTSEETNTFELSPISSVYEDSDFRPSDEDSSSSDDYISRPRPGTSTMEARTSVKKVLHFDENKKSNDATKSLTTIDREARAFIDIYETIITLNVFKVLHAGIYKAVLKIERREEDNIGYTCYIVDNMLRSASHECVLASKEQQNVCITHRSSTTEICIQINCCLDAKRFLSGQEHYFIPTNTYMSILHLTNNKPTDKKYVMKKKLYGSKKHYCLYCRKLISHIHISRHILNVHKQEEHVKEILRLSLDDNSRHVKLKKLRLQGDKLYNFQVPSSLRISVRRSTVRSAVHNAMCPQCNAFISKNNFSRHYKKCSQKPFDGEHVTRQALLRMDEETDPTNSILDEDDKLARNLLARIKTDQIGCVASTDRTIQLLAKRAAKLHYRSRESCVENDVSNIRRAARLLIHLRSNDPNIKELRDVFTPDKYRQLVKAVRSICQLERRSYEAPNDFGKPGLSLQYGCIISRIIEILLVNNSERTDISQTEKNEVHEMLKKLKFMHSKEYRAEVSRNALDQNAVRRLRKSTVLPTVEDIRLFSSYVHNMASRSYKILTEKGFDKNEYKSLLESVLCQLLVFNRRRVGEMSAATLNDYRQKKQVEGEQLKNMTRYENIMAKHFTCMFILGKRSNVVPVLITPQQIIYLDYIINNRFRLGVPDSNNYLFAFPNKLGHVDASIALRNFSKECGATNASSIRGTYLRRQVATLSQLLVLDDNSIQELADYMGHTVEVHKEFYRRPELTQQVTKLARFFSVITSEDMSSYRGKSILELEPDIPEPDFDLNDIVEVNQEETKPNFDLDIDAINQEEVCAETEGSAIMDDIDDFEYVQQSDSQTPPTPAYSPISVVNVEQTPTKIIDVNAVNKTPKKRKTTLTKTVTPRKQTTAEILNIIHTQVTPTKFRKRQLWSAKETALLLKIFNKHIREKQLPSMAFCGQVLTKYKNVFMRHRNDRNIYSWVQYRIKTKKQ